MVNQLKFLSEGPQPFNFVPFTPNKWENFEGREKKKGLRTSI